MGKKKILLLAVAYLAIALLTYSGRSLEFDEASRGMAGAFYADLFSGVIGGKVGPGSFMAFVGNYHDHYKIAWDVIYFPPLQPMLMALAYAAFGISARSSLLVNALAASLSLFLIHRITLRVFGRTSLIIPLMLGFSPAFFFYARSAYYDITMTFFYLLALHIFLKWLDNPSAKLGLMAGLAAGAGFITKYPAALALPAIFLSLVLMRRYSSNDNHSILSVLIGFSLPAVPWIAIQTKVGNEYFSHWIVAGLNMAGSGAAGMSFGLPDKAASTVVTLASGLSAPLALIVAAGLFFAIPAFRSADQKRKNKMTALACWSLLYILVFAVLPISHLEINKYRYFLPALPLLLAAGVGPLIERFGKGAVRAAGVASIFLALSFFAPQFESSWSHYVPVEEAADYFLALSNNHGAKSAVKLLAQDPALTFALRERDPELKRFFVFYYPPTGREIMELLADNSSSRSLRFFGLQSCGIEYATLTNYGFPEKTPNPAKQVVQDFRFDRIIKGKDGSSIEIYRVQNATQC